MAVMLASSDSLRLFGWRSAMCTSRSRPGSAAGSAMSIGALGGGPCVAGATAVVCLGALAESWRAGVLTSLAVAHSPAEGGLSSPAKARRLVVGCMVGVRQDMKLQCLTASLPTKQPIHTGCPSDVADRSV